MNTRWATTLTLIFNLGIAACGTPAADAPTPGAPAPLPATDTPSPRLAQLTELQKAVEAQSESATDWRPAAVGNTIRIGGGARTKEEARARLDITDGTIVRLAANTTFRLTALTPAFVDPVTQLALDAGKVWVQVTTALGLGKFEVVTPVGISGVRGSLMSVEYDPASGRMTVTCLEGRCFIRGASGATTELGPGEQAEIAGAGLDPTPAHLIEAVQLAEWALEFPEAQPAVATATAQPRPTGTPAAQSACDHPYFPLRAGAAWQRLRGTAAWTLTAEAVNGDLASASVTMSDRSADTALTYTWTCTPAGLVYFRFDDIARMAANLLSYYGALDNYYTQLLNQPLDSAAEVAAINLAVTDTAGVALPPAAALTPGATWSSTYQLRYFNQPAVSPEAFINQTLEVVETHTAGAAEELETALGTVTVIPVVTRAVGTNFHESSIGSPWQFGYQGGPRTDIVESVTTVYYALGVGIVRTEWSSAGREVVAELTSHTLP